MTSFVPPKVKYLLRAGVRIKRTKARFVTLTTQWEDFTTTRHAFFAEDDLIKDQDRDMVTVQISTSDGYRSIRFGNLIHPR